MRLLPTRGSARRRPRRHRATSVACPVVESLEGRVLLTGRPPGNTGTGFYVVGSNIYDANGNQFVIRGINQSEAWGNPTTNFAALSEFPKTQANAVRVIFSPGLGANSPSQRAQVVQQLISEGIVPIVEDNGAASEPSFGALDNVVNRWLDPANVAWLKQDEKYVILDIAGEWGQSSYTWAEGYESEIARIRAAGINCMLMVVAPDGGSNVDSILTWGQQILNSDPQHNVVFSVHMYYAWTTKANIVGIVNGSLPYDISSELQKVEAANLPLVVGEFSSDSSSTVNYSTQQALQIFQSLDIGWIAWSWDSDSDPTLSMVTEPQYQYNSDADLRPFGNLIVNDPNVGLKATSLRASIFPPGVSVEPDSNMETTQAGGTAQFLVSLDSPPAANVLIPLSSSDTTQGVVPPIPLTFTPADWNVPQIVTVTGLNNGIAGSNTAYTIATGPTVSDDPAYNGLNPPAASLTNINTDGPVQIVADGAAGWSQVGPWIPSGPGGGYLGGESHSLPAGVGANTITWSFPVAPGLYQIESTWTAASSLADNAPYAILNNGTQIGMLRVDEQVAPNDLTASGANWKVLGSYLVSGGTLQVQLSDDADGAVIADAMRIESLTNTSTIVGVTASPPSVLETGTTGLAYTFTRTGSLVGQLTVAFGVGGTATFGTDYSETGAASFGATSGTVTFAPASATAIVTLNPINDGVADGNETAVLTPSAGTGYAIGFPSSATGTITDAQVSLAVSPASVFDYGSVPLVYTFTRNGSLVGPLTVSFTVGGTAALGYDYSESGATTFASTSGTVTIPDGIATATVTLNPIFRYNPHPDKTAVLTESYSTGYEPVSPRAATGTFADNNVFVNVATFPTWVAKDGPDNLVYNFSRTGSTAGPLTINFTVGGTAVLGTDYTESGADSFSATSGTITIPAGTATASVVLAPINDNPLEPNETAVLTVTGGSGYGVGGVSQATGVITDTTSTVSVTVSPAAEPEGGSAAMTYTFTRVGSLVGALTVPFAVGGTAAYGTDYTETGAASFGATAGTVTFAASSATVSVTVTPVPGDVAKPNQTVIFTLSAGIGLLTSLAFSASGTIATNQDITTQGNWIGTYGSSGYAIVAGPTNLPAGDTVTPTGQSTFTWTTTSTDPRALQVPGSPNRVAAVWYSPTSFSVDVNLGDGLAHYLELYFLDWDNEGRAETVQLSNATTGAVLSTLSVASFQSGEYLYYTVSGNIKITITSNGPANAVLNGLFLDPAAAATFLQTDTTTQGTWIGTYGATGYDIVSGPTSLPAGDTVTPAGQSTYTLSTTSTDPTALQVPNSSNRVAAVWYSATSFSVDVDLSDGAQHNLELYFVDLLNYNRNETVQISNVVTGAVLSTQTISSFQSGEYLDYAVSGHIRITITNNSPANAVLNGLFLDGTGTPTFVREDTTTQGNWIGTYGSSGYAMVSGPTNLPAGDTITPAGQYTYTYSSTSTDPRALQVPNSSNRVAAVWFSSTSFTVDVNLGDGKAYNLELYLLDWDNRGRAETVQISNAATGTVLSTQSVSSFQSGVYLDYAVSGNILITITNNGPANAVLNGLFLDGTATPTFVRADTTTQGTWIGTYGATGYDIVSGPTSLPSGDTVTPTGQSTYTVSTTSTDPRALQVPNSSNRVAAVWYSATSFSVDVNLGDAAQHNLELYFDDLLNYNRNETVQISNAVTGAVLSTQTISSFQSGEYLDYAVSGNILITITNNGPANAVLNGLFLGGTGTGTQTFVREDTTTQGNWIGTYGSSGYAMVSGPTNLPAGDTITPAGQYTYTYSSTSTDPRALQVPNSSNRVAAVWFSSTSFTVDVNLGDGKAYNLELYLLDWDNRGRAETVQISNAATGTVLSTQSVSSFQSGVYLDYAVSGNILITITNNGPANAVLNGLFLDGTATPTFVRADTTTQGTWIGTYGATGYDIVSGPTSLPSGDTVTPTGQSTYTVSTTSTDPTALQVPNSSNRVAAVWYSATSFSVDVNLGDGKAHNLELYFDDLLNYGRAETVQITDVATGNVLSTQTISSFQSGEYLDYAVSGHIRITITNTGPANAVLSGLFLD